ncbi:glycoside hydrolase family 32 protein [Salinicoccus bachuensis]|uniref:Sucrose-6-phosphate hydrolase n=1 Tax=Salinicoccus bachuensis TaxID=3136731 RepID=A0ABZ3CGT4_9STAP
MKFDSNTEAFKALDERGSEALNERIERTQENQWKQKYHVQPIAGSMDSIAGFVYHDGTYHILYQWSPFEDKRTRCLYHVTTNDLVSFENRGIVKMLSDGAYSGSAFVMEGNIHLYHTEVRSNTAFQQYTTFKMEAGGLHPDRTVPVIKGAPPGYRWLMKDPKVWHGNGGYIMMLGAATSEDYGRVLVFAGDTPADFQYRGELETHLDQFGFMWESPDHFELDGHHVFMFCPQGLDRYRNSYWNIYQSGYTIGEMDYDSLTMNHGPFHELDHGFDFYAPQTTLNGNGERLMIGWMGMKETGYPTDDSWSHCLTLPRELSVEQGQLRQKPAAGLRKLREAEMTAEGYFDHRPKKMRDFYGDSYELVMEMLENDATRIHIDLRVSRREQTSLIYNSATRTLILDTAFSGEMPENVDGTDRKVALDAPLSKLQIFVDVSSIEVFANDGEAVMTARIFPSRKATGMEVSTEIGSCHVRMTRYSLKQLSPNPVIENK